MTVGSKLKVWNGTAHKTSGGLTKKDLMLNKHGKVVSIKQHKAGLVNAKNLGVHLATTKRVRTTRASTRSSARGQDGKGVLSGLLGAVGLGLSKPKGRGKGKHPSGQKGKGAYASAGGRMVRPRRISGKGIFDDLANGFSKGAEIASHLIPLVV